MRYNIFFNINFKVAVDLLSNWGRKIGLSLVEEEEDEHEVHDEPGHSQPCMKAFITLQLTSSTSFILELNIKYFY